MDGSHLDDRVYTHTPVHMGTQLLCIDNWNKEKCWLTHTEVGMNSYCSLASFSPSFTHKNIVTVVGKHIYLSSRRPSPVDWLTTSPSLDWPDTDNIPVRVHLLLYQSVCGVITSVV